MIHRFMPIPPTQSSRLAGIRLCAGGARETMARAGTPRPTSQQVHRQVSWLAAHVSTAFPDNI
jgi:hypothetical protein